MSTAWERIGDELTQWRELQPAARAALVDELHHAPPPESVEAGALLDAMMATYEQPAAAPHADAEWEQLLRAAAEQLRTAELASHGGDGQEMADRLAESYRRLGPAHPRRHELLALLGTLATGPALAQFARLAVTDPPTSSAQAALAFAPLFREPTPAVAQLYPGLLDALQHEALAAVVLDLANHLTRKRVVDRHPAVDRAAALTALFSQLADRLKCVEENPSAYASSPNELTEMIHRSVALGSSLADALGLIGRADAIGPLRKALELGHRRMRSEAAAALVRLGETAGVDALAQLAADAGSRTRALAYLEELGKLESVPAEHQSPQARAEGELAAWLGQPSQFGIPPSRLELVDSRSLYWPGYDQPQECYLLRYRYEFPRGTLHGIGLAGPLACSLSVDFEDLPPWDIYATYCGWYVEHDEIADIPLAALDAAARAEIDQLREGLTLAGYDRPELAKVGRFFGRTLLVFRAVRDGRTGVLVCDGDQREWFGSGTGPRSPGPAEAWYLTIGREILRTFNPT